MAKKPEIKPRAVPSQSAKIDEFVNTSKRPKKANVQTSGAKRGGSIVLRKEKGELRRLTVYMPPPLFKSLKHYCVDDDEEKDLSETICKAVEQYLTSKGV